MIIEAGGPAIPCARDSEELLVSIVVPCFRQAQFLPEAVESLLSQTWPGWECIIVDDGSPDETRPTAEALMREHPRANIRLFSQANQGVAAARNAGFSVAKGSLFLALDADDRLAAEYLERCCARFREDPRLDIVYTDMQFFGSRAGRFSFPDDAIHGLVRSNTLPIAALHRREVWQRADGFCSALEGYEDWDYWLAAAGWGARAVRVALPLFRYRVRPDGRQAKARQALDTILKAQLVLAHPLQFSAAQYQWAAAMLWHANRNSDCPPLAGQSFAQPGEIPFDGEAFADLASAAFWSGDIPTALAMWLAALRAPELTAAGRSAVLRVVRQLGLEAALRAVADTVS